MRPLSELDSELDYTSRVQWEKFLKSELKIEDTKGKTHKVHPDGTWPTLSLETPVSIQLPLSTAWKKAAQTYINLTGSFEDWIEEDLAGGVRAFYLEKESIEQSQLDRFMTTLENFHTTSELEVFLLGDKKLEIGKQTFKVVDELNMISGRHAFMSGGNNIQELSLLSRNLIDQLENNEKHLSIGVFIGTHFFRNIAKIRATKLLVRKILDEAKSKKTFSIVALTSYREWTLFERYSNILRNDVSVASSYIAGADHIQSSGYQALFDLEANLGIDFEHTERSRRMARNTSHILALESMLGVVGDAAFGSYHLESLTQELCEKSWTLMQKLVSLSASEGLSMLDQEITPVREERRRQMNTRRIVMAGTNDYPDTKDHVGLFTLKNHMFRLAQDFESIRLKTAGIKNVPKVFIALYGDYGALNARLNFVKNYFELLGLEVTDAGTSVTDKKIFSDSLQGHENDLVVICSSDDLYPEIIPLVSTLQAKDKFVAGKVEMPGFQNLFAGQNVFEILSAQVSKWGVK